MTGSSTFVSAVPSQELDGVFPIDAGATHETYEAVGRFIVQLYELTVSFHGGADAGSVLRLHADLHAVGHGIALEKGGGLFLMLAGRVTDKSAAGDGTQQKRRAQSKQHMTDSAGHSASTSMGVRELQGNTDLRQQ